MTRQRLAVLALAGVCIASPYLGLLPAWTPALATTTAFIALALIGLNLIFGMTGMLALGQAAFVALPGYMAGILEREGVPALPAMASGILFAVGVARILAELFVRLPGIYFAVGTLGFSFVLEGLARAFPSFTGGASGLVFDKRISLGPLAISSALQWYAVAVTCVTVGVVVYAHLVRGRLRRTLRTIQHDELAAHVLGIEVARMKVRVFTLGSAYSAVGGVWLAHYVGVLIPESGGVNSSLEHVAMTMLGGPGSVVGPLLGAFLVQWLFSVTGRFDTYELLVYGLAFLAAVMYAPGGLVGLLRRLWRALPWLPDVTDGRKDRLDDPVVARTASRVASPPSGRQGLCLRVEGVSKSFGGLHAVRNASLEVRYGEVVGLIGPNGAGKSTLFNLISGVETPSAGRILLRERDLVGCSIPSRAMDIGRSFQVPRLVPELTAVENVMVRLDNAARDRTENERLTVALAQLVRFQLLELANRRVSELGLGQRKLIDVARAAVDSPPLLLLDEIAAGLTPPEIDHLVVLVETLRSGSSAVLVVEHNVDFVAKVADRLVVMDQGQIIASGRVDEVIANEKVQQAYFGALK